MLREDGPASEAWSENQALKTVPKGEEKGLFATTNGASDEYRGPTPKPRDGVESTTSVPPGCFGDVTVSLLFCLTFSQWAAH